MRGFGRRPPLAALMFLVALWVGTGVALAAPDDEIPGVPISIGPTVNNVVDNTTDPNDVCAVKRFAQEQEQIKATESIIGGSVDVLLLAPGAANLESARTLMSDDTGWRSPCDMLYTPAKDGVYFIRVEAGGSGVVYTLTVGGSAEKVGYPTFLRLRTSASVVKKGRSVTLSATLVNAASQQIGGKAVALLRSYDCKTWKAVKSLASPDGRYSCRYKVTRKTSFRLWFGGDADWGQCTSRRVTVNVR